MKRIPQNGNIQNLIDSGAVGGYIQNGTLVPITEFGTVTMGS